MTATVLFVPGLRDHVEDHWQTHAARVFPGSVTVEPLTLDRLSRAARVAALDAALQAITGEVVIAAHSAGCLMVAHWALAPTRPIKAALLSTRSDQASHWASTETRAIPARERAIMQTSIQVMSLEEV